MKSVKFNENVDDNLGGDFPDPDYLSSINEPEKFWGDIGSQMVTWDKMFEKVLDDSTTPFTKWFSQGYLNACYNCIDRHVADGKGSKVRFD
jgi:hypothetical protein